MKESHARTIDFSNKLRSLLQVLKIVIRRLYKFWIGGCLILFFGLSIFIGFYDLLKGVQLSILDSHIHVRIMEKAMK